MSSGPRWRMAPIIRPTEDGSTTTPFVFKIPAIPHISIDPAAHATWQALYSRNGNLPQGRRHAASYQGIETGSVAILDLDIQLAKLRGGQAPAGSAAVVDDMFY